MATKLQIIADSNSTYVDNTTGNITPTTVKALNTDWINSTVFAEQTSSMSVATASFAIFATTASFVAGNVASASTAILATTALTASSTPNAMVTGSVSANILTFTKGNGTTFSLSIAQSGSVVSSSYSDFSNQANSASLSSNSLLLQGTGSNGFVTTGSFNTTSASLSSRVSSLEAATSSLSASIATVNSRVTVVSSSLLVTSASLLQVSASYIALSASYNVFSGSASTRLTTNSASIASLNNVTASYAVLANNQTFTGKNTFNNDVTASNVRITGTASIAFLDVQFQSSSVIYSSGSNQFGDASNDTQTLYGTVNVVTGPLVVTGSVNVSGSITVYDTNNSVITHHLKAPSTNGVEILNNSNGVVGLFGAGGSLGSTFYGQVNATAFSGSGALVYGVVSSSFASTANTANTATTAINATSASYADTANFANTAEFATSASIAQFAGIASAALTASYATTASSAEKAFEAVSSSYAISSSLANTASFYGGTVTSASFAQTSITASFATNFVNSGSYVITGSHRGNVVSQSIASSTASFDFATANFFTLNLTGSTLTHISASNIQAGQTVNLRITQGTATGSVSFSSAFDQVSGSAYTPTAVSGAVDILTFITFDNSLIYVSNIKNLV